MHIPIRPLSNLHITTDFSSPLDQLLLFSLKLVLIEQTPPLKGGGRAILFRNTAPRALENKVI